MKTCRWWLLGLLWWTGALGAATPLESARRAQAMLGPGTWSRVIRIENTVARSPYPATVYALVFEEAGLLWFYTAIDGTQSLSLHVDRAEEEKADLSPLLREIDPGFARWSELPDGWEEVPRVGRGSLPNGCFIESLAALRERVRRGEPIERARLLSCYFDTPVGRRGHTVLTFETPRGLFLLDPLRSPEPRRVPRAWADDADSLAAAALPGARVTRARWVPTELPAPALLVAGADRASHGVTEGVPRLMR